MKLSTAIVALVVGTAAEAQSAPRVAMSFPPAEQAALEQVRKDVWVNWFAGDTAALKRVLGPELVAMGANAKGWQSRDESLGASAKFAKGGAKLVSVSFANNVFHRLGDVALIYSVYTTVVEAGGKRDTESGRVTEVFVRNAGQWVHTSWHLDKAP